MAKKKVPSIINGCILLLLIVGGFIVINHSTFSTGNVAPKKQTVTCSGKPPIIIKSMSDPHLQALTDYQKACRSFVTNKLMIFTGFSGDETGADENAKVIAQKLQSFYRAGVTPIVIAEPYSGSSAVSYRAYLAGAYDASMEHFFQQLKAFGVTNEMMGTWVPFPESNTPTWNNKDTELKDFALCVNKYLGTMKRYFPSVKGSVLLNATTYAPSDTAWENGNNTSLAGYVDHLDKNLVTSFGIQGFPWMTNAQQTKRTIFKATEFLQPNLATAAAKILQTRDIWMNTGTFASKYTDDPTATIHLSPSERKAILEDILKVAKDVQDHHGYHVSINLFSEDKSNTNEATDWSYLHDASSIAALKDFLAQANEADVPISLYDKAR